MRPLTSSLLIRCVSMAALASAASCALAQNITQLEAMQTRIPQGSQATVLVEFKADKSPWCGLNINWGNGEEQDLRIGDDDKKTTPLTLTRTYPSPGVYTVVPKGKYLQRGLKSASACDVSARPIQITVFDPAIERAARQREQERQQAEERQRAAQTQADLARRELELRQRDLAQKELELKRKELELKEAELRREEESRRAERERAAAAAAKAAAATTAPPAKPAPAAKADAPPAKASAAPAKGTPKSSEGF
jgi:hypothetical protein